MRSDIRPRAPSSARRHAAIAGTQFANRDGVLKAVAIVALAYGVGLLVAGTSLALSERR